MSIGYIYWIYIVDILPDTGVGISSTVSWIFTIIIAAVCPFMIEYLGVGITFIIFAFFNLTGLVFAICFVIETKGKSAWQINTEINKIK